MQTIIRAELPALSYQRTHSLLIKALADHAYWQDAKNRFRTGTIGLVRDGQHWVVNASADLVNAILPF